MGFALRVLPRASTVAVGATAMVSIAACMTTESDHSWLRNRNVETTDASVTPPTIFEETVDASPPPATCDGGAACTCTGLSLAIQTMASCGIKILPGFAMDGDGFISVGGAKHQVFAIDRVGKGHVIAWCDATTNKSLVDAFDVRGYLSQKQNPKLGAFGSKTLCSPPYLQADFEFLGADLPLKYQGDPAKLAADYDALVFCGYQIPWAWDFSKVLIDYVTIHGRGLLLSMDYVGYAQPTDFQKMNVLMKPAGIAFDPVKLDWAAASIDVKLECVPDLAPPPR